MKTLEEKAEELLAEIGVEDILFTTNEIQHQYISDLMVRFAKALLEEAAEKILNEIRESKRDAKKKVDDARIQIKDHNLKYEDYVLNCYLYGQGYIQAKTGDMGYVEDIILSLIPKDTTKD